MRVNGSSAAAIAVGLIAVLAAQTVLANGGPFVVTVCRGDPPDRRFDVAALAGDAAATGLSRADVDARAT
jgi:hypothetical protein